MIIMNSVLTQEERALLHSLSCKDREHAITVLNELKMPLPVRSELFYTIVILIDKLKDNKVDFSYDMNVIGGLEEE